MISALKGTCKDLDAIITTSTKKKRDIEHLIKSFEQSDGKNIGDNTEGDPAEAYHSSEGTTAQDSDDHAKDHTSDETTNKDNINLVMSLMRMIEVFGSILWLLQNFHFGTLLCLVLLKLMLALTIG